MINEFIVWLEKNGLERSADNYSRAINTISKELIHYNKIDRNIYNIDNVEEAKEILELYLSIPQLEQKDKRGKRMYSNAIKRYIEFIGDMPHKKYKTNFYDKNDVKLPELNESLTNKTPTVTNVNIKETILEFVNTIDDLENIRETEKEQIVKIRIGHSIFKQVLLLKYKKCLICGLDKNELLIASHIKPWSKSENNEKLDIENGLLLCPHHDSVFDKGFISFNLQGNIIISNELSEYNQILLNIRPDIKISLSEKQKRYMKWHYENLFRKQEKSF